VWSYPPAVLLFAAPFGLLPYLPALALWTATGPIVFLLALRQWTCDPLLLLAAVLCPAAIFGLISGQLHFILGAILLTVLRLRNDRPWLAGALIGLLLIKPQLALFFPLLLLVERNGRAILAAALSVLVLAGLTALIWGPQVWLDYVRIGIPTQSLVLSDPDSISAPFMPTVLMNLRGAGVSLSVASTVQALASILAAAVIAWHFWRRRPADDWAANAGFLAAAVVGTPYLLGYDTIALGVAALLALAQQPVNRFAVLGCWLLVIVQMVLGEAGLPEHHLHDQQQPAAQHGEAVHRLLRQRQQGRDAERDRVVTEQIRGPDHCRGEEAGVGGPVVGGPPPPKLPGDQ
jgi:hypothetical protein